MQPTEPHSTHVLPPHLYRRTLTALRLVLPPPLIGDPYDTTERDTGAMEDIAAMRPANSDEAALAVQVVAAHAMAMDIMAVTVERPVDALKHWAASANMFRQARGARSLLARLQTERMKQERLAAAMARGSVPETESRLPDNETDVRRDRPMSPDMVPWDRPRPPKFVPDPAIIARLVADKSLTKRSAAPSPTRAGRHSPPPARSVPSDETISEIRSNETDARPAAAVTTVEADNGRQGQPVSHAKTISQPTDNETDARLDKGPRDGRPPRVVSHHETSFELSANETALRPRILASSSHTPPDIMPARPASGLPALELPVLGPPFTSRPPYQGPCAASPASSMT